MEIGDSYPTLDSLIEKNGNPILIVDAEDYPEDKRMDSELLCSVLLLRPTPKWS